MKDHGISPATGCSRAATATIFTTSNPPALEILVCPHTAAATELYRLSQYSS